MNLPDGSAGSLIFSLDSPEQGNPTLRQAQGVNYADTRIRWRSRCLRRDGILEYVFNTQAQAEAFTLAMNFFKGPRARMAWWIDISNPCRVEAQALGGWVWNNVAEEPTATH